MKNYLVVGGSSGIGLDIAKNLAQAGNQVTVLARSWKEDTLPENIHFSAVDISLDEPEFPAISEAIDGLVYCPGTINLRPFKAMKQAEFMNDLQINYLGAIKSIQKYLPQLQMSSHPSIVLFSTVAVKKGMPFHASIAGAKGAVEGLTKSLAAEFAPKIRVNAIAPSLTETPLAAKLLNTEAKISSAAERHPLKKIGSAQDISKACLYLLNAEWVSGEILSVDGGMSSIGS
ncbi:MAG: SDR family oxidoreductase [Bacteroidia bacterium]|nr:SDR family oxidoreductase [Bacteroidia bacterium]